MIHDFEEIIFIKVWRKRYQHYLDNCTMKKSHMQIFEAQMSSQLE
ncbi:HXXEE domain-containing protein [Clostridium saccharobutylicum]|nr:HXXEE domain-containing protein [Clostridium saccharobutylicum]